MTEASNIRHHPLGGFLIRHRTVLVVAAHGVLVGLALLAAFLLAYNFRWSPTQHGKVHYWFFELYLPLLAIALPVKLLVFQWTGQYQGSWRYVGLRDLFGVINASLVGSFLFLAVYFVLENVWRLAFDYPLIDQLLPTLRQSAVFLLDWAATVVFVSAARVLARFYYEDIRPQRGVDRSRVLIVGAGDAGEAVLREILRMRRDRYTCVGFLDDEVPLLRGRIHGVEVLGRTNEIRDICRKFEVREVLIALPRTTPKYIREIVEQCEGTGVLFRTVPPVSDVITGRVQVSRIRDVDIADLLGREPVKLDSDMIGRQLRGKRVLVTGAGGSVGAEMCRQIAAFHPQRLVLLERFENNLFEIDRELRRKHPDLHIVPRVADIGDRPRLRWVFEKEEPAIVFHAAAHKHVPMMELNPGEAVKNNIAGTVAVADASLAAGVEKMVMISTDKAVNPTSVMGCTKRIAEMYVECLAAGDRPERSEGRGTTTQLTNTRLTTTQFITVRFGNVLGSSGSVVPIFTQQIAMGGPVTVTHPDMVRFFMTITEAAQLVLQAGTMGKGGEIYVLHMGEPVKIVDLARDMITLSGLRPGVDIEIELTGKRPGEKLYEELSHEGEHIGSTAHPKIGIWKHRPADLATVKQGIERLIKMADRATNGQLQSELERLVPEYTPDPAVPDKDPAQPVPSTST